MEDKKGPEYLGRFLGAISRTINLSLQLLVVAHID